jgi:hypothetical protein
LLWWGKAWLDATSSIGLYQEYGVSLPALLKRLNFPTVTILIAQIIFALLTLYVVTQAQTKFSQINIGFLIIGSLLISPYANTHSLVIVLAFGVAPLVLEHPFWGIPLFILYNAPFLTLFSGLPVYLAPLNTYWAVVLCISWFMLCWVIFRTAITKNTYHDFLEIRH